MASLPFPADMSPTRLALAIGVGASASAAAIVFLLVGNAILAAGFLAAALVVGGVAIAVRLLMPVPESQPRSIDWDFTRAVAQASGDAVAITDRAGRLVCANDAYDRLFAGFPTPPGLPLDDDGIARLGDAGRTAWREGRGVASGLRGEGRCLDAEIARAGEDGDGRRVEDTEWHRITCFNGVGKTVAQYVEKGQKVMVRGRIHYTRWTDSENIERYGVEIIADEVTFLSYGKSRQQQGPTQNHDDLDDDVPF